MDRDKLALINRQWKYEKGKIDLTINLFTKTDEHDRFCPLWQARWENFAHSQTNQNAGFVEFSATPELRKNKVFYFIYIQ